MSNNSEEQQVTVPVSILEAMSNTIAKADENKEAVDLKIKATLAVAATSLDQAEQVQAQKFLTDIESDVKKVEKEAQTAANESTVINRPSMFKQPQSAEQTQAESFLASIQNDAYEVDKEAHAVSRPSMFNQSQPSAGSKCSASEATEAPSPKRSR